MKRLLLFILSIHIWIIAFCVDHYAVAGTTWDGTGLTWAATSGGVAALADPTSSDDVYLNAATGAITITIGVSNRNARSLICTGFTGTLTDGGNQYVLIVTNGNVILVSGMTLAATIVFNLQGSSSSQFTSAGKTLGGFTVNAAGGTWTLQDDLTISGGNIILTAGTLDLNSKSVSANGFSSSNSNTRVVTFGSTTLSLTSTGTIWNCATSTNLTVNANTGTIKFTGTSNSAVTFAGGDKTYNNVWFSRAASTGTITITGANTFNDFKDDGTAAHTIVFPNSTTTVTTFTVSGTAGNLKTFTRTGGSGTWTISAASGQICRDYLSISNSTATGGASWYAGANSTDGGGNTGWTFTACPSGATNAPVLGAVGNKP